MDALKLYCQMGSTRKFIGKAQNIEQCVEMIIGDCKTRFTVPKSLDRLEFRDKGYYRADPESNESALYILEKE